MINRFPRRHRLADVPVRPGSITVTDFPSAGRPADFKGLIGPLSLGLALDRPTLPLGEGTVLRLTVTGPDLSLLARPTLPVDPAYRIHPLEEIDVPGGRSFSWNLAPLQEGPVTIAGLSLPYYDPATAGYKRADSGTIELTVLPGRRQALTITGRPTPTATSGTAAGRLGPALILPEPLRGAGAVPVGRWLGPVALLAGLVLGLVIGLARWQAGRPQQDHRGRALARAMAAADWEAADRVLHRLQADCPAELQADLVAGLAVIEQARFGGAEVDAETRARLLPLEQLPWGRC